MYICGSFHAKRSPEGHRNERSITYKLTHATIYFIVPRIVYKYRLPMLGY